jgi:hypothetical protein
MIKFIKLKDETNQFDTSTIEHTCDSVIAHDVVDEFFLFLQGCGWHRDSVISAFQAVIEENGGNDESN